MNFKVAALFRSHCCSVNFAIYYHRTCRPCKYPAPLHRALFPVCGHAVCRSCADKEHTNATEVERETECPDCNNPGSFVPLFEEQVQNDEIDQ